VANGGKDLITGFASYDSLLLNSCNIGGGEKELMASQRGLASLKYNSNLILAFDWVILEATQTLLVSVGSSNGSIELYTLGVGGIDC